MPVPFSTFECAKDVGVTAYRGGDFAAAGPYLIQAGQCMVELAGAASADSIQLTKGLLTQQLTTDN